MPGVPIGLDLEQLPLPNVGGGSLNPIAPSVGSAPGWLSQVGAALDPTKLAIGGLAAGAGAIPTPSSGTTNSTSNFNSTTTPNLSPENQALLHQLTNQYSHLAQTGVNLQPYQEQGMQNINNNSGIASKAAMEALAARGLSTSPVAGTVAANQENNRIGQITELQNSIPLLQNQMNLQNLGSASQFAASIPHGTTQTGTQTGTSQTQTQQGGGLGGFLGGLGKAIGGFAGLGKTGGGAAGTLGKIASIAAMFSDERLKEAVSDTKDGLSKVLKMKPKDYKYIGEDSKSSGFMAQDLEKLFPDVVDKTDPSGYMKVKYHELLPKIVKSIQELNSKVDRKAA